MKTSIDFAANQHRNGVSGQRTVTGEECMEPVAHLKPAPPPPRGKGYNELQRLRAAPLLGGASIMRRQSIGGLLGAAALAATLSSLAPLTATAQTPTNHVFLSNEDNVAFPTPASSAVTNEGSGSYAQEFTTGPYTGGLVPRRVTLWFSDGTASDVDSSALTVGIWRNVDSMTGPLLSDGSPAGRYITLTNPADLGGPGEKAFTYSGGQDLGGNIRYHIVVQYNKAPDDSPLYLDAARDAGASEQSEGWSVNTPWNGQDGSWTQAVYPGGSKPRYLRFKFEGIRKNTAATGEPDVMGSGEVGLTLTANPGDIADGNGTSGVEYEYQWLRYEADSNTNVAIMSGGQPVTGPTYTVTSDDLGKRVGVKAVFTDNDGHLEERFSGPATAVVAAETISTFRRYHGDATSGPEIAGTIRIGETVTINLDTVMDPDGKPPALGSGSSVTVYAIDRGNPHPASYSSLPRESFFTQRTGDYAASFTLQQRLVDRRIMACLNYRVSGEWNFVCSPLYGPVEPFFGGSPVIEGTPMVGETLTATIGDIYDPQGVPAESEFEYQWLWMRVSGRDQRDIPGANSRTYTLGRDDVDQHMAVRISFDDLEGNPETRLSGPFPSRDGHRVRSRPPTSGPTLMGTFRVGQELRVDTSTIVDPDGISDPRYRYRFWHVPAAMTLDQITNRDRVNQGLSMTDIVTSSAITVSASTSLTTAGERKAIAVVWYADDTGERISMLTGFSNALAGPNRDAEGKPEITGTTQVGETLTAVTDPAVTTSDIADADGLPNADTYTYQWERETSASTWEDIEGATDSSYLLMHADGERKVRVTVSFIDNLDARESLTSDPYPASGSIVPNQLATGEPAISGTAEEGITLMVAPGTIADGDGLTGATYTYAWYRQDADGSNRSASAIHTGTSYRLAAADAGKKIVVVASFRDDDSVAESRESAPYPMTGAVAANMPATGKPAISGATSEGHTLTASPGTSPNGIADGNGLTGTTYTYAWYRQDADGTGRSTTAIHTGDSYLLAAADVGKQIVVIASFADDNTNDESRESDPYPSASGSIANNAPADGKPEITGTASTGQTLTAVTDPSATVDDISDPDGLPDPPIYTYVWEREETSGNWQPISGATSSTYLLASADAEKRVRVVVSFTDGMGHSESLASDSYPRGGTVSANSPATGTPEISGTASVGETLTAVTDSAVTADDLADPDGLPAASAYTYQWVREDRDGSNQVDIQNANGSSYTLVGDDGGKRIRVRVSFMDSAGGAEARLSEAYPATGTVSAPSTGQLAITGTVAVGAALTAVTTGIMDPNGLTSVAYSFQWQRADDAAGTVGLTDVGTDSETYTPAMADQDRFLRVTVTYMDDDGNEETRTSDWSAAVGRAGPTQATGEVTIDDGAMAQVDVALTADTSDIDDPANGLTAPGYTYQWQRADDAAGTTGAGDISGAVSQTYTPTKADDQGKYLRVMVTFTDDDGYEETKTSAWTSAVERRADVAAEGALTVSGMVKVGESLAADATAITDANGMNGATFAYQWQRRGAVGAWADVGTNSPSYAPTSADIGLRLRVRVSFTDEDGYPESVTSDPTAPITPAANNLAAGAPAVSGPARVGRVLQAATRGIIRDDDGIAAPGFTYQWQRGEPGAVIAWIDIPSGATSSTYTLTAADEGMKVRVKVTFTDDLGSLEELPSAAYPAGPRAAIVPADAPGMAPGEEGTPYPGALVHAVAGFGHSVAAGIVDGIWSRGAARRTGSLESRVTLGGKTLDTQVLSSGDAGRAVRKIASMLGIEATAPSGVPDELDGGRGGGIDDYRAWAGIPDSSRLASQSSFALTAANGTGRGGAAFWGEFSTSSRESETEEGGSAETETSDMLLGFDLPGGDSALYGLVVSRSSGESDYMDASTDTVDGAAGTAEASLLTFAPYLHWSDASGKSLWASVGTGSGSLEMTIDGGASEVDIGMTMLAAGARSAIAQRGRAEFALKGDVYRTAMDADGTAGFKELSAEASRIRVALERVSERTLDSGAASSSRMELGARMDSGDGEDGAGADVAAEFRYASPGGLEISGRLSTLLLHSQEGFGEFGAGLGVAYSAGGSGRGASLSLEPTWNAPRTGVAESMWGTRDLDSYASSDAGAAMKARLGYGAGTLRDRALATLYSETEAGDDSRRLRIGAEMRGLSGPLDRMRFDVYGEREERVSSGRSDAIMLEGRLGF